MSPPFFQLLSLPSNNAEKYVQMYAFNYLAVSFQRDKHYHLCTLFLAKQIVNIPMYEKNFLRWCERNSLTPRCRSFNLENDVWKDNISGNFLSSEELSTLVHLTEKLIAVVQKETWKHRIHLNRRKTIGCETTLRLAGTCCVVITAADAFPYYEVRASESYITYKSEDTATKNDCHTAIFMHTQ